MKILHLYKDYFPVVGGIENHIKLLSEAQAARGQDVTVLVTSADNVSHTEIIKGVRVIFAARFANFSSAPLSIELFQQVTRLHPDITHLHFPYPVGEVANYFFGHARALVLTYHSDILRQRITGALYTPMLHRVLMRVSTIIATSPTYIQTSPILNHWQEKCVVIPLASPLKKVFGFDALAGSELERTPTLVSNPITRTSIHSNSDMGQLLFVGRLRYYKGLNYLLEALPQLPNAHLTVVGIGPQEKQWQELAHHLGVNNRVSWVGEVSDEELPAYYAACDIFVLPCSERSEAFGAVQLEAMAAGKPVVSCDVNTGVAWVNQNGITGLVVPPKNPSALAEAIALLLREKSLRDRMGEAGRARVAQEFTVEKMVARVMQVYKSALENQ